MIGHSRLCGIFHIISNLFNCTIPVTQCTNNIIEISLITAMLQNKNQLVDYPISNPTR